MELGHITGTLWRLRLWVLLGVAVAALSAIATGYRIQPGLPPSLEEKTLTYGTASTELLVDSNKSSLGKFNVDLEPLSGRAQIFARFVSSAPIKNDVGRRLRIPPAAISTPGLQTPVPRLQKAEGLSPQDLVSASANYRLIGFSTEDSTVVNLFAQAPTVKEAVRLANTAAESMSRYVERVARRQKVRKHLQLRLRQLGPADGGLVNKGANRIVMSLAFAAVLLVWCLGVLLLSRIFGGSRTDDGLTRDDLERLLQSEDPSDLRRARVEP